MITSRVVSLVIVICLIPPALQWLGVNFGTPSYVLTSETGTFDADAKDVTEEALFLVQGVIVHSLIEWTAVCFACIAAVLSAVHYFLKRDVTTPVIATALTFAGLLDGFRVLAIDRLIVDVSDAVAFTQITWAVSRLFHIVMLVCGTLPFVVRRSEPQRAARDLRDFVLLFIAYGLAAFLIIYYAGQWLHFDGEIAVANAFSRRINFLALVLFAVAGSIVLTVYGSRYRGIFSASLVASLIPHSAAQLYATFGSEALYDAGFNLASLYKLIAYMVPTVGLTLDYRRASRADTELATTSRQLSIARDIQASLLPRTLPTVGGIDVAGYSVASEAVGGDYYDHIELPDGSLMAVVADVSGHDLGAALLIANARAYLKAWAEDESDLAVIAEHLNEFVAHDAQGRRFITAMMVKVPSEGDLHFVCAGHAGYIIKPDGSYDVLEQKNVPLGVFDELKTQSTPTSLAADETLLLVTDGIVEVTNRKGCQFGIERCAAVIGQNASASAADTLAALRAELDKWTGNVEPFDDMTVLLLKRKSGAGHR